MNVQNILNTLVGEVSFEKEVSMDHYTETELEKLRKRSRELDNQYHSAKRSADGLELYKIMRAQCINSAALKLEEERVASRSIVITSHKTYRDYWENF